MSTTVPGSAGSNFRQGMLAGLLAAGLTVVLFVVGTVLVRLKVLTPLGATLVLVIGGAAIFAAAVSLSVHRNLAARGRTLRDEWQAKKDYQARLRRDRPGNDAGER